MRGVILILLIVYGCFGCANKGDFPSYWDYLSPEHVYCSEEFDETKVCRKYGTKLICECVV